MYVFVTAATRTFGTSGFARVVQGVLLVSSRLGGCPNRTRRLMLLNKKGVLFTFNA